MVPLSECGWLGGRIAGVVEGDEIPMHIEDR